MCRKMFSFHGQFGWPPQDDGLLIPSNSEVLLPLLPFSSSVAMQSSNTAQNQIRLLIVDDVWNMNPDWQWDGTMSWIKAKASCMYFERSRVPFLKVGYLLLVEILTSLAKKKKSAGREWASVCEFTLDAFGCDCFSPCNVSSSKAKSFFAIH